MYAILPAWNENRIEQILETYELYIVSMLVKSVTLKTIRGETTVTFRYINVSFAIMEYFVDHLFEL